MTFVTAHALLDAAGLRIVDDPEFRERVLDRLPVHWRTLPGPARRAVVLAAVAQVVFE